MWWKNRLRKILLSKKELSHTTFERLKETLIYIKNNLTDSDNNMYLTVDSLIDMSIILTGSDTLTLPFRSGVSCFWQQFLSSVRFNKSYQNLSLFLKKLLKILKYCFRWHFHLIYFVHTLRITRQSWSNIANIRRNFSRHMYLCKMVP